MPGKWKGIQINHCQFQGEIVLDPVFHEDHAFLTLRTKILQRDQNGQFVEVEQDVPLMVEPSGPVNVARKFIQAGRQLMAWCHWKTWEAGGAMQHAFVVSKFDLGHKPFEEQAASTPDLPEADIPF